MFELATWLFIIPKVIAILLLTLAFFGYGVYFAYLGAEYYLIKYYRQRRDKYQAANVNQGSYQGELNRFFSSKVKKPLSNVPNNNSLLNTPTTDNDVIFY